MTQSSAPQSSPQTVGQAKSLSAPSRISVVFGDPILDAGHTATPNLILNSYARLGMSPQEMMFIIHLLQHKWDARNPYPSLGSVARRMGVSLRQVQRYEASLIKKGYLRVTPRMSKARGQLSNEYNFASLIERILALGDQQDPHDPDTRRDLPKMQGRGDRPRATPLTPMSSPGVTTTSPEEEQEQTDTSIDQIDRENRRNKSAEAALRQTSQSASETNAESAQHASAPQEPENGTASLAQSQPSTNSYRKPNAELQRGGGLKSLKDLMASGLVMPASQLPEDHTSDHALRVGGAGRGRASRKAVKGRSWAEPGMSGADTRDKAIEANSASQRPTAKGNMQAASFAPSARIAETVKRISQAYGDTRIEANTSQLMGLYNRSRMSESAFEDWVYTVWAEMRERRAKIKKPMAYLYTTLKNRLRL